MIVEVTVKRKIEVEFVKCKDGWYIRYDTLHFVVEKGPYSFKHTAVKFGPQDLIDNLMSNNNIRLAIENDKSILTK